MIYKRFSNGKVFYSPTVPLGRFSAAGPASYSHFPFPAHLLPHFPSPYGPPCFSPPAARLDPIGHSQPISWDRDPLSSAMPTMSSAIIRTSSRHSCWLSAPPSGVPTSCLHRDAPRLHPSARTPFPLQQLEFGAPMPKKTLPLIITEEISQSKLIKDPN
jgi:hypothetical protein